NTPFSRNVCSRLGDQFDNVAAITIDHIERLAQAVRSGDHADLTRIPDTVFDPLNKEIREAFREEALDAYESEAVEVVRWAWSVVVQQVNELADCVVDKQASSAASR
nr:hypothetical protein [Pseudomonas sp.]